MQKKINKRNKYLPKKLTKEIKQKKFTKRKRPKNNINDGPKPIVS